MTRVYKWNKKLRCIASDCKDLFHDLRSIGDTWELCCAVTHRMENMMGYLDLQDITRNRRPITHAPEECTGAVVRDI